MKPDKLEINVYEAREFKSGYVVALEVYQGATSVKAVDICAAMDLEEGLCFTVIGIYFWPHLASWTKATLFCMDNCILALSCAHSFTYSIPTRVEQLE